MDEQSFAGRKALVTGASRGIGRAIAGAFAKAGADLAITGRRPETLAAVAAELAPLGRQILPIACHQGREVDITQLFEQLDRQWGRLDIAVINAGTNPALAPLVDLEKSAWDKTIEVNLTGAFLTAQAAARRMSRQGAGAIVFMSSIAGIDPMSGLGAYSVSKAGLIGLTKALAKELGPRGVRVNALAPGLIETHLSRALIENRAVHEAIIAGIPLGRHGQPDDVVGAALFLASDAAGYVTGQVLVVDGGSRM